MSVTVQELNQYFIDLWGECETGDARLPDLGPRYSAQSHTDN
jgi:hypothetical protein